MPARVELSVKTRVLLLGNDSTLERDIGAALRSEGCEVIWATDCREAIDMVRTGRVDVLVMDFHIHSKEFPQLAPKSSLGERCCRTLVLAGSLEELTFASEGQVDGVLIKPVDPNQARIAIHNLLADVGTQAQAERWQPDTSPHSEALSSQRDWGLNE
jgi:DNA-binding response OmpR family regulator